MQLLPLLNATWQTHEEKIKSPCQLSLCKEKERATLTYTYTWLTNIDIGTLWDAPTESNIANEWCYKIANLCGAILCLEEAAPIIHPPASAPLRRLKAKPWISVLAIPAKHLLPRCSYPNTAST